MESKRHLEWDLAKFFAILLLFQIHPFENWFWYQLGDAEFESFTTPQYILQFFSCAPLIFAFLFCCGIGMAITKHSEPLQLAGRALKLYLLGIVVNLFEELVPIWQEGETVEESIQGVTESIHLLFAVDIYGFFALVFLLFAIASWTKKQDIVLWGALGLSLVGNLLNSMYPMESTENVWIDAVYNHFIHVTEPGYFPIVNWLPWVILGYFWGRMMKSQTVAQYNNAHHITAVIAAVVLGVCYVIRYKTGWYISFTDLNVEDIYYNPTVLSVVAGLCIGFLFFYICFLAAKVIKRDSLPLVTWASRHIMEIYVVQWIVVGLTYSITCSMPSFEVELLFNCALTVGTFLIIYCIDLVKGSMCCHKSEGKA